MRDQVKLGSRGELEIVLKKPTTQETFIHGVHSKSRENSSAELAYGSRAPQEDRDTLHRAR